MIAGVAAWRGGQARAAFVWNCVPSLLLAAVALLSFPSGVTLAGVLYFMAPAAIVAVCGYGYWSHSQSANLFWGTLAGNLVILGFLIYLSFFFRIF